jgi:hypothetical protein
VSNIKAMSKEEAHSLRNHFDFDRFYEQWDESHSPKRLSTEGLEHYALDRWKAEIASAVEVPSDVLGIPPRTPS